jgi:hypothetical protein
MVDNNSTEIEFKTVHVSWNTEVAITALAGINAAQYNALQVVYLVLLISH